MNRSFSKLLHIQKSNLILEQRRIQKLSEQSLSPIEPKPDDSEINKRANRLIPIKDISTPESTRKMEILDFQSELKGKSANFYLPDDFTQPLLSLFVIEDVIVGESSVTIKGSTKDGPSLLLEYNCQNVDTFLVKEDTSNKTTAKERLEKLQTNNRVFDKNYFKNDKSGTLKTDIEGQIISINNFNVDKITNNLYLTSWKDYKDYKDCLSEEKEWFYEYNLQQDKIIVRSGECELELIPSREAKKPIAYYGLTTNTFQTSGIDGLMRYIEDNVGEQSDSIKNYINGILGLPETFWKDLLIGFAVNKMSMANLSANKIEKEVEKLSKSLMRSYKNPQVKSGQDSASRSLIYIIKQFLCGESPTGDVVPKADFSMRQNNNNERI